MLCDVMCDVMPCNVMWCEVMDVMWCDMIWCDVMWCDWMWCDMICDGVSDLLNGLIKMAHEKDETKKVTNPCLVYFDA